MRAFLVGLQFLTHIHIRNVENLTLQDFSDSVRYFPLVGLVLGTCYAVFACVLDMFVPLDLPQLKTFLLAAGMLLLTGAIHADGFMDTCDGIFSGRERARMLEIMKDSRVGTFGVVGFVLFFFAEYVTLYELGGAMDGIRVLALFFAPIFARIALVFVICAFPYARLEGMGKAFKDGASMTTYMQAALFLLCIIPVGCYLFLHMVLPTALQLLPFSVWSIFFLILILILTLSIYVFCRHMVHLLGGLTGDVYGAVVMLTEILTLLCFLLLPYGLF